MTPVYGTGWPVHTNKPTHCQQVLNNNYIILTYILAFLIDFFYFNATHQLLGQSVTWRTQRPQAHVASNTRLYCLQLLFQNKLYMYIRKQSYMYDPVDNFYDLSADSCSRFDSVNTAWGVHWPLVLSSIKITLKCPCLKPQASGC